MSEAGAESGFSGAMKQTEQGNGDGDLVPNRPIPYGVS